VTDHTRRTSQRADSQGCSTSLHLPQEGPEMLIISSLKHLLGAAPTPAELQDTHCLANLPKPTLRSDR